MRKEEFLKQLEYLLQDIPDADRDEAMAYYRDYLEEAGTENEDQVIEEFGSPERVAAIIRADVTGNLKEGGAFTENGYEDERFRDPNFQVVKHLELPDEKAAEETYCESEYHETDYYEAPYREASYHEASYHEAAYDDAGGPGNRPYEDAEYRECSADETETQPESKKQKRKGRNSQWIKWILVVILLIVASPVIVTVGGVVFGAVGGVFGITLGIAILVLALTAGVLIVSVCLAAFGLAFLATTPLDTLFLFGFTILGIGCGLLGAVCCYLIFGVFAPFVGRCGWKFGKFIIGFRKERRTA